MIYSSKIIEEAVDQIATLPGIGKRTALRLVLHLLRKDGRDIERFTGAIQNLHDKINYCTTCFNLSDTQICQICSDNNRDASLVCVVQDIRDVMAIESTQQFPGRYHVLGGIISPMDGVGPQDLRIKELVTRLEAAEIKEVIFALSTTMEGETTSFYLYKKIAPFEVNVSSIARGIAVGDEIEYADEVTLGRSILNRQPYSGQ